MTQPVYRYVEVCADTAGVDCVYTVQQSLLPPMSVGDSLDILSAAALVLAIAWGVGVLYRLLFFKTR